MAEPFKELCRLTGQAVAKYEMIAAGDRILVGLSGGKDSFALLHALHALRRKAPVEFGLIAATFDPGFPEFNLPGIAGYCRRMGWEHRMVALPVAEILEEKKFTATPCVLCSRLRRGKLYGLARELGCNKLALGQHFDDIAASFLMSLCRGQGLTTMGPNVPSDDGMIRVIRPFAYVEEKTTIRAAAMLQIPPRGECVYKQQLEESGDRAYFKRLLHRMELRVPGLLQNMRRSLSDLRPEYLLDPRFLPPESVSAAVTPRSPSSEEPCSPRKQNDNR